MILQSPQKSTALPLLIPPELHCFRKGPGRGIRYFSLIECQAQTPAGLREHPDLTPHSGRIHWNHRPCHASEDRMTKWLCLNPEKWKSNRAKRVF